LKIHNQSIDYVWSLQVNLKVFISTIGLTGLILFPSLSSAAATNSANFSISVVVPERIEDQQCNIGFQTDENVKLVPLQHSSCLYDSKIILQAASQLASNRKITLNTQGFVTVVVTAP